MEAVCGLFGTGSLSRVGQRLTPTTLGMSTRDKMRKLVNLLEHESPVTLAREAWWRAAQRWRKIRLRGELERHAGHVEFRPVGYYLVQGEVPDRAIGAILRYADCVCRGQFPWFGYGPVNLGFPPRWNFDFVSGKDWPQEPRDSFPVVRNDGSDVKVPWDLSRLQFLPVLAKAWRLTGEERFKECGKALLSDWIEKNPVAVGVNWTIAMEAALRAISICFFLELLWPAIKDEYAWIQRVTQCLWQHLLYIEAHNEFSYLARSNHYLSNIVGLFCLSSYLQVPQSQGRRELYCNLVQREIEEQVYLDGGSFEASSGYHLLATQMFATAYELMLAQDLHPAQGYSERLCKMYTLLAALTDQRGCVPHVGDCDDGRVELLSDDLAQMTTTQVESRHSLKVQGLLGIGQTLFRQDFGGTCDDIVWHAAAQLKSVRSEPDRRCSVFPQSGIVAVRNEHAKVVFLAQPNGIRGRGSHTHNDKLSVLLWIGGKELLVDSGTGCYTRDATCRNRFRSTSAHNTIQIDGQEQNRFSSEPTGLFQTRNDAGVSTVECRTSDSFIVKSAHYGYCRLNVGHLRTVHLQPERRVTIEDKLEGSGEHTFEAFFHLPRTWQVSPTEETGQEVGCVLQGACRGEMRWRAEAQLRFRCLVGQISRAYGSIQEATTLSITGTARFPFLLTTQILWDA